MDLLQLEHFVAVAEEGNFTRAAERVFRTQPAISLSVKKLEDEIGAPLFARDVQELTLTGAGKLLLESARRMLQLRDEAMKQLKDLQDVNAGHLSIAAHESAAVYLLPVALREYFLSFPNVRVGIERNRLEDIPRRVMDRDVDVGFVKDCPDVRGLQSIVVHTDEMVLVASPRHPLSQRKRVRMADLAHESFVLHHQCSSTEQKILRLFDAHSVRCRIGAELWSFENVKDFVKQDIGLAIVPKLCVNEELRARTLVRLTLDELKMPRKTIMIFREGIALPPAAQEFINIVNRMAPGRNPKNPTRE